jgi:hypothetical protein
MTFLFTRGFPIVGRVYAALFVFFTFCATIGLGEHYLADLIVGMSLVLMVRGLTAARLSWRDPDRVRAVFDWVGDALCLDRRDPFRNADRGAADRALFAGDRRGGDCL